MRGELLATAGRRLVRDDTFETIVSPAIADLQYESSLTTGGCIVRGYPGVWRAVAGAVRLDFGRDLRELNGEAATLTTLVCMQACYYTCLLTLMSGLTASGVPAFRAVERIPADAALMCALVIVGLSTIPTLFCFWPARR